MTAHNMRKRNFSLTSRPPVYRISRAAGGAGRTTMRHVTLDITLATICAFCRKPCSSGVPFRLRRSVAGGACCLCSFVLTSRPISEQYRASKNKQHEKRERPVRRLRSTLLYLANPTRRNPRNVSGPRAQNQQCVMLKFHPPRPLNRLPIHTPPIAQNTA